MSTRLGILGGMFDPVHNGHIEAARFAVQALTLQQLDLVPCHIPNHRAAATSTAEHRLAMLRLATAGDDRLKVNSIEIERSQVSYTVDTLATIGAANPDATLVFVLGIDAFNTLPAWHRWQELLERCHLFVLARELEPIAAATSAALNLVQRRVESPEALFETRAGRVYLAQDFHSDLSSSRVRAFLQERADVSALLDKRVKEYIHQHALYTERTNAS